jgi:hypothetical protein
MNAIEFTLLKMLDFRLHIEPADLNFFVIKLFTLRCHNRGATDCIYRFADATYTHTHRPSTQRQIITGLFQRATLDATRLQQTTQQYQDCLNSAAVLSQSCPHVNTVVPDAFAATMPSNLSAVESHLQTCSCQFATQTRSLFEPAKKVYDKTVAANRVLAAILRTAQEIGAITTPQCAGPLPPPTPSFWPSHKPNVVPMVDATQVSEMQPKPECPPLIMSEWLPGDVCHCFDVDVLHSTLRYLHRLGLGTSPTSTASAAPISAPTPQLCAEACLYAQKLADATALKAEVLARKLKEQKSVKTQTTVKTDTAPLRCESTAVASVTRFPAPTVVRPRPLRVAVQSESCETKTITAVQTGQPAQSSDGPAQSSDGTQAVVSLVDHRRRWSTVVSSASVVGKFSTLHSTHSITMEPPQKRQCVRPHKNCVHPQSIPLAAVH